MISNFCYKVFVVCSYFVEKTDNFHYNPVEGGDFLENLLNWSMYLGDSNNGNIRDLNFVYFFGGLICFLLVCIIIIVFCKSVFLTFFMFFTVLSLVYMSDSPYVSILEQPKV